MDIIVYLSWHQKDRIWTLSDVCTGFDTYFLPSIYPHNFPHYIRFYYNQYYLSLLYTMSHPILLISVLLPHFTRLLNILSFYSLRSLGSLHFYSLFIRHYFLIRLTFIYYTPLRYVLPKHLPIFITFLPHFLTLFGQFHFVLLTLRSTSLHFVLSIIPLHFIHTSIRCRILTKCFIPFHFIQSITPLHYVSLHVFIHYFLSLTLFGHVSFAFIISSYLVHTSLRFVFIYYASRHSVSLRFTKLSLLHSLRSFHFHCTVFHYPSFHSVSFFNVHLFRLVLNISFNTLYHTSFLLSLGIFRLSQYPRFHSL